MWYPGLACSRNALAAARFWVVAPDARASLIGPLRNRSRGAACGLAGRTRGGGVRMRRGRRRCGGFLDAPWAAFTVQVQRLSLRQGPEDSGCLSPALSSEDATKWRPQGWG